jgi:hypothetical protein
VPEHGPIAAPVEGQGQLASGADAADNFGLIDVTEFDAEDYLRKVHYGTSNPLRFIRARERREQCRYQQAIY